MGITETFQVLSDPIRRDILLFLKEDRKNAGEIANYLGISPAALSYHLKILKKAGLLMEYKQKNYVYYELNIGALQELVLWVHQFCGEKACGNEAADEE